MTIYENIKSYLELQPLARERKTHARAMINLLLVKYPELKEIPKDKLVDFCRDFESYTREWRAVTKNEVNLRGSDYEDKTILEQEKMINLGYEVNPFKKEIKAIYLFDTK